MKLNEISNQAIDYILKHINEVITVEDVAEYCHFSKYYFNRLFKAETGESIYSFIQRMRMERSAFRLKVDSDKSITEIGYDYGYSPSNYSAAFRKYHHISPIDFRKKISAVTVHSPLMEQDYVSLKCYDEYDTKIHIRTLPDYKVIYERRKGCYTDMRVDWPEFQHKYQEWITKDTLMMERSYDDPAITDSNYCLYDLYLTVPENCTLENTTIIKGGKFAIYHFEGYATDIFSIYQGLFCVWCPKSCYEIDERYGMDIYRDVTEDGYFHMDFCIPVK